MKPLKSSEILARAKQYLWDGVTPYSGESFFICITLTRVPYGGHGFKVRALQKEIERRLDGEVSVRDWLRDKAGVPRSELTQKNVQAYRHRWVDHLIEEYVAKGD
jgi:hypothetical protein